MRRGLRVAWAALLGALAIVQAPPALVRADEAALEETALAEPEATEDAAARAALEAQAEGALGSEPGSALGAPREAATEAAAWLDSEARLRPSLPVRVSGRWDGELRVVEWEAKLELDGDAFTGEIRFPHLPVAVPLTVAGKRAGDLVEFSVRYAEGEVAYFGGHLAGTSLVGAFEGITGERGQWSGSWVPETLRVEGEAAR